MTRALIAVAVLLVVVLLLAGFEPVLGPAPAPRPEEPRDAPAGAPPHVATPAGELPEEAEPAAPEDPGVELVVRVVDGLTGHYVDLPEITSRPERFFRDGRLRFELPDEPAWVLDRHTRRIRPPATPFAEMVEATCVVWPAAPVVVRAVHEDGRTLGGAVVSRAGFGEKALDAWTAKPTGPDGTTRLAGVPRIPGETLTVDVEWEGNWRTGTALLDRSRGEFWIEVLFGEENDPGPIDHGEIGIGGGAGGAFGRRMTGEPATLRAIVLRHDGSPASGATVVLEDSRGHGHSTVADEAGVAWFEGIAPGPAKIAVRTPGFFFGDRQPLDLPSGGSVRIELVEERGRPLTILVRDHERRPLPGASVGLRIKDTEYADVRGTRLVANHVTDPNGRVFLPRVPGSVISVTANYGTRFDMVPVGKNSTVEPTIPGPKPPK